ncbi:MAG: hypothetical protein BMS9Abin20_0493 [Acidimicrobiia bacterium]|nr:MAG: hypothetical protein BMS9Abin20_0493 [Acidimicrobiia bacterium]
MTTADAEHFEDLLRRLEEARIADEALHRRTGSLTERAASRDTLTMLRAEIARVRAEIGFDSMEASGLHDSRTRRGVSTGSSTSGRFR